MTRSTLSAIYLGIAGILMASGCQKSPPPEFGFDRVEWLKQEKLHLGDGEEFSEDYLEEIPSIMEAMFGTPEHAWFPFPKDRQIESDIVSPASLRMAAGAVASREQGEHQGLYREHCAECHGISGDGAGPTAGLLYPYPRDFRLGKFKFKSTPQRHPPTTADLRRTLMIGVPGTAMPSFSRLSQEEIDALIDYVKYLSIRGNFEKYLIWEVPAIDDEPFLDENHLQQWIEPVPRQQEIVSLFSAEPDLEIENGLAVDYEKRAKVAADVGNQIARLIGGQFWEFVVKRWAADDANVTEVPAAPSQFESTNSQYKEFVQRGHQLFLSKGGCVQCHGKDARGVGEVENNYDDWTNNWLTSPGVDPNDQSTHREFKSAGALTPRVVSPRNLRLGVYRGGGEPEQIYRRIANGIEGTPMPAGTALSNDEIWALVAYVMSLPEIQGAGANE